MMQRDSCVSALAPRLAHGSSRADKGSGALRHDLSLRAISAELAEEGHLNERGRPFNPKSVGVMLAQ